MSKGIYINSINTYLGTALYDEFLGEKPEESEWELYSTYYEKEDNTKPAFIKKMMKQTTKPGLFRKYMLDKFEVLIYDLHCGKLEDLKFAIKALTKNPLEKEKIVIVISSVLSWAKTPFKMVEDKPEPKDDGGDDQDPKSDKVDIISDEEKLKLEEYLNSSKNIDEDGNIIEIKDNEGNLLEREDEEYLPKLKQLKISIKEEKAKQQKLKNIKYKRVGYEEDEYQKRIPADFYQAYKDYEDELLKLKFENLSIYIICSGIPYGNAQTVFNYHFKSAWLQSPEELPYFEEGRNIVPTIHVKDLTKIIKLVIEKKPENHYVFAFDLTKNKASKNLISSISVKVGSGKTCSISQNENYIKNLNFNSKGNYVLDPSKYVDKKLNLILTANELNWQAFLNIDVMLANSKLYEPEEFGWHCKDFNNSIYKLLKEFTKFHKLRPMKIVMNCENQYERCVYAEELSKFYNIPIVNTNYILKVISLNKEGMSNEELAMFEKYFALTKRIEEFREAGKDESDPTLDEEELLYDVLKTILNENACLNRGYIIEGLTETKIDIERLYYQKVEIKTGDDDQADMDGADVDDMNNDDNNMDADKDNQDKDNADSKSVKADQSQAVNNQDVSKNAQNQVAGSQDNSLDASRVDDKVPQEEVVPVKKDTSLFIDKQDQIDEEERLAKLAEKTKPSPKKEKKKKIKVKKFKKVLNKKLLPESVITIGFSKDDPRSQNFSTTSQISNPFFDAENFFQRNGIEVLNTVSVKNKDEMIETMRIYIERNGRPYNYYIDDESQIHQQRLVLLDSKQKRKEEEHSNFRKKISDEEEQMRREYWAKMEKRIADIKIDKQERDSNNEPTRKFLLLNIMPILTKAMLEICKIDPIDPIEYLADYLFENSTA